LFLRCLVLPHPILGYAHTNAWNRIEKLEQRIMHQLTKQKARRLRRVLVALPDPHLQLVVGDWIEIAADIWPIHAVDDALLAFGYQIRAVDSGKRYASWDEIDELEAESEDFELVPPVVPPEWRSLIVKMPLPTFYHTVIQLAGEALDGTAFTDNWGPPPGEKRSGYDFMDKLAEHLALAAKLGQDDPERFAYAARRLGIIRYSEQELQPEYPDIDGDIERLVRVPDLPYWMRHRHKKQKLRSRRRK
jgi:hypothetical protein